MKIAFYTSGMVITGGNKRIYYLAKELQEFVEFSAVIVEDKYADEKVDGIDILSKKEALSIHFDLVISMNPLYCDLEFFRSLKANLKGLYILHLNNDTYTPEYQHWINVLSEYENFILLINNPLWNKFYKVNKTIPVHELIGGYKKFEIKKNKAKKKEGFNIIVNGNHTASKGFNDVLRSIGKANIKNHNIIAFASRMMQFNSNHRMKIHFNVPFQNMWEIYLKGDIFIYFEDESAGWGNTAFEAIMCNIPVICTKNGTQEFAEHLKNTYIIERDVDALSNAIELFYNKPDILSGMNNENKLLLNNKYGYKALAEKIYNIVKNG